MTTKTITHVSDIRIERFDNGWTVSINGRTECDDYVDRNEVVSNYDDLIFLIGDVANLPRPQ